MKTISPRLRDFIVAVLTAIITYLCSSCSLMWIKGNDNNPVIDNQGNLSADSTSFLKVGYEKSV